MVLLLLFTIWSVFFLFILGILNIKIQRVRNWDRKTLIIAIFCWIVIMTGYFSGYYLIPYFFFK